MALNRYLYDLKNYLIELMLILPEKIIWTQSITNLLESVKTVLTQCISDMTFNYEDIFIYLNIIANLIDLHEQIIMIPSADDEDDPIQ